MHLEHEKNLALIRKIDDNTHSQCVVVVWAMHLSARKLETVCDPQLKSLLVIQMESFSDNNCVPEQRRLFVFRVRHLGRIAAKMSSIGVAEKRREQILDSIQIEYLSEIAVEDLLGASSFYVWVNATGCLDAIFAMLFVIGETFNCHMQNYSLEACKLISERFNEETFSWVDTEFLVHAAVFVAHLVFAFDGYFSCFLEHSKESGDFPTTVQVDQIILICDAVLSCHFPDNTNPIYVDYLMELFVAKSLVAPQRISERDIDICKRAIFASCPQELLSHRKSFCVISSIFIMSVSLSLLVVIPKTIGAQNTVDFKPP